MKQYEYVRVELNGFLTARSDEHRAIIDRYAADGWRWAGYIPTETSNDGRMYSMDLIFERDTE